MGTVVNVKKGVLVEHPLPVDWKIGLHGLGLGLELGLRLGHGLGHKRGHGHKHGHGL